MKIRIIGSAVAITMALAACSSNPIGARNDASGLQYESGSPDTVFNGHVADSIAEGESPNQVTTDQDRVMVNGWFDTPTHHVWVTDPEASSQIEPFSTNIAPYFKKTAGWIEPIPNQDGYYALAAQVATITGLAKLSNEGVAKQAFSKNVNGADTFAEESAGAFVVQADGKPVIGYISAGGGGNFTSIMRFNTDGTPDKAFNNNANKEINGEVYALALTPEGSLLVGGGDDWTLLHKLNPDGTKDTTFHTTIQGVVTSIQVRPDGRIVTGGNYTKKSIPGLRQLTADGQEDPSFSVDFGEQYEAYVAEIQLDSDGNTVVAGDISTPAHNLVRYKPDGSPDEAFNNNIGDTLNEEAEGVKVDEHDNIYVWGAFTTPSRYLAKFYG